VKSYERTVLSKIAPLIRTIEDTLSYKDLVHQPSASQTAVISTVSTTEDESLPPQTPYVSKIGSTPTVVLALLREQSRDEYFDSRTLAALLSDQNASPFLRSRVSKALGDLRRQGLVETIGETNRTMRYRAIEQGSENPLVQEQEALQPTHVPAQHDEALHGSYAARRGSIAETLLKVLHEHSGEGRYLGRKDLLTLVNAQRDYPVQPNSLSHLFSKFIERGIVESKKGRNRAMQYRSAGQLSQEHQALDAALVPQILEELGHGQYRKSLETEQKLVVYLLAAPEHTASRRNLSAGAGIRGTPGVADKGLARLVDKELVTMTKEGVHPVYTLNMNKLQEMVRLSKA
jgi:DNA-binding transcriptional regulator YhcF (GntR family)/DNA-binding PadR family transcriptional regulator